MRLYSKTKAQQREHAVSVGSNRGIVHTLDVGSAEQSEELLEYTCTYDKATGKYFLAVYVRDFGTNLMHMAFHDEIEIPKR